MSPKNIVILGGGIIGSTTAFYLARHPSIGSTSITLLEASKEGVAQGASGKAGGLVAKWAYPKELAKVSFKEHVKLAKEWDGEKKWGWRWTGVGEWEGRGSEASDERVKESVGKTKSLQKKAGLSASGGSEASRRAKGLPSDLTWVNEDLTNSFTPLAPPGDTAQVHPYLFTTAMLDLAIERGVRFIKGRVTSIQSDAGHVTGVQYTPTDGSSTEGVNLTADSVILAAGAWSPSLLPSLPISGYRAHSIVIHPSVSTDGIAPYVLFTSIVLSGDGRTVTPEIYPRPDSTIYVCGPGDTREPLPLTVDDVKVDLGACQGIWEWVAETGIIEGSVLGDIERQQACYLPIVESGGGPIVGNMPGIEGLVVATGHTCWGICNAPGTAKALGSGKVRLRFINNDQRGALYGSKSDVRPCAHEIRTCLQPPVCPRLTMSEVLHSPLESCSHAASGQMAHGSLIDKCYGSAGLFYLSVGSRLRIAGLAPHYSLLCPSPKHFFQDTHHDDTLPLSIRPHTFLTPFLDEAPAPQQITSIPAFPAVKLEAPTLFYTERVHAR
ncbi:hypothetical protein EW146_g2187 [Bondarzewia mesenterica]|uniref:FAD dependent oxidoreductase domain-containing protein n=1 Tax=Bondarzewia mesenterica TaxID=1095465 RepID=A0A4S4M3E4_9AGAM|nr:hypothetical protein EW146_g2187 [Bondarzewia mesenterica]